jgi:hypothetical protein
MVMKISVQEQVRMTPEVAKLNSPLENPPRVNARSSSPSAAPNRKAGSRCRKII